MEEVSDSIPVDTTAKMGVNQCDVRHTSGLDHSSTRRKRDHFNTSVPQNRFHIGQQHLVIVDNSNNRTWNAAPTNT